MSTQLPYGQRDFQDVLVSPRYLAGSNGSGEADAYEGNGRFLANPSLHWADAVRPLTEAGWRREAAERSTVEIVAPTGRPAS